LLINSFAHDRNDDQQLAVFINFKREANFHFVLSPDVPPPSGYTTIRTQRTAKGCDDLTARHMPLGHAILTAVVADRDSAWPFQATLDHITKVLAGQFLEWVDHFHELGWIFFAESARN